MWPLLIIVVLVSSVLSWRLVGVIVESKNQAHREIARKTLIGIWGSSVLGSGTTTVLVRLYELGILGP
ncbi:hypothetical protein [Umezawaea sp. Da 62-37]|uniref:hypothetical protein n=1 Tax=Umezawaea sp. Da 62-37 TaxID=3075927 RepID=UPI0028F7098A|nr:hypothetical protein [Umezawaea sp. Da 62-37]WNV86705.1 hypothetical protein RM788_52780 [Umezawaea sp. Da 62-37]WNV86712.1 hypothetical protein RM788_00025 [Umezawaea sp. Da 62-37]